MGRDITILACDFETTVWKDTTLQDKTEVWSSAFVELYTEDVYIAQSIEETLYLWDTYGTDIQAYYHNLKFDGSFIVDWLMRNGYRQAYWHMNPFDENSLVWLKDKNMPKRSFKYTVSSKGQWYEICIRTEKDRFYKIYDSVKLIPFSLEQAGKAFNTKHRKTEMEYDNHDKVGIEITPQEKEYIENDVLVLKEILEFMFNQGHTKLTIGSCCMSEFRKYYQGEYANFFPDLTKINIDSNIFQDVTADSYIRRSYRGAWTYIVPEYKNRIVKNGVTLDVNSLYPSVMHSVSGNYYPVGKPCFWEGSEIPTQALEHNRYYFIRIKTSFKIKEGYLPTIQIKGNWLYKPTEFLERSALYYNGKYYEYQQDEETGERTPVTVTLTLTKTDWELINEHYELYNTEILSGCWFRSEIGLFDEYIDHYMEIKENSKGAMRTEAKLFLNNLYGKLASSDDSSFKLLYLDENQDIKMRTIEAHEKKAGYIAIGSAITSYARAFTIRHAQMNYHGKGTNGFAYADTDSLHCDITLEECVGIDIHPTKMLHWKCEKEWDYALFVRQKTYIEHVIKEDQEEVEKPYHSITCAGMPERCKKLFKASVERSMDFNEYKKLKPELREWVRVKRKLEDFKIGLQVPDKLLPVRVKGGIVLKSGYFTMR